MEIVFSRSTIQRSVPITINACTALIPVLSKNKAWPKRAFGTRRNNMDGISIKPNQTV